MHKYLRSIGFRSITNDYLDRLYYKARTSPDWASASADSEGNRYMEYRIAAAKGVGIAFRGRILEGDKFRLEYYFPYVIGNNLSTKENPEIIRESDREGYHGMCDELKLGVELIFFLQEMITMLPDGKFVTNSPDCRLSGVRLSALASEGVVLLPIKQTVRQLKRVRESNIKKYAMLSAARNGDEDAMERLAREEMDLFAQATKRAETEDVFSIVNTYFMPEGIESDKYSVLGIIQAVKKIQNVHTQEEIYILTINCNRVRFDVSINSKDLIGEPAVGRRLRAKIWMQGMLQRMSL